MTESQIDHPTAGRRRRYKSPPVLHGNSALPVPRLADHLDTENGPSDEEGEKEAKRQRSEPTAPISTSSRLPYEYDQLMGITQVESGDAEGFEEGLDLEYHDATENPGAPEPESPTQEPAPSHGGCGSSSLRECIELLNNTGRKAPATCHSGVKLEKKPNPRQVMSPSVEEGQVTAENTATGSVPVNATPLKKEPLTQMKQVKAEALTPKVEASAIEVKKTDVKEETEEPDITGQAPDASQEEVQDAANAQPFDSEDSLSQEHVASELRRLEELRMSTTMAEMRVRVTDDQPQNSEGGAVAPGVEEAANPAPARNTQGAVAPESEWNWEDNESYAPQRSGRYQGRMMSPDPYMFNSPIWVRHDDEESVRMYEDPMDRLRDRVFAMEHNLETLRTRLTHVADLRDAQGIREDHRAITARLNEVEECATVHTLREFMSKIRRLEAMFTGEDEGAIVEAIRACNRRLDSHRDTMDDFHARISTQDWYHDISDQEGGEETENQPGVENRPSGRRRIRGHAPQRRLRPWTRTAARPPPPPSIYDAPPTQDMESSPAFPPDVMQQAMQRLFTAYNQCVNRVAQTDDRMEQFRTNLRRDALELALNVKRTEQDVQYQQQAIARIKETLFEDVQEKVKSLEERLRHVMDHEMHVNQTIESRQEYPLSMCFDNSHYCRTGRY